MRISKKQIAAFQKKILSWYEAHKRDLPWREIPGGISLQDRAYRVLVSEVMLQQTQVNRVIPKYEVWLAAFPTVAALAGATTADVLRLWSGLGYNRRALNLQKAAKMIVEQYSSSDGAKRQNREVLDSQKLARTITFPRTVEELKKLPGVGEYTARAIACFAFGEQIAMVDTNIRKVILLKFFSNQNVMLNSFQHPLEIPKQVRDDKKSEIERKIQSIADKLLPQGKACDWNQALMDYAGAMLKKEKIPIVKQSKFRGSNRYYRGKLIRLLLQEKEIPVAKLGFLLKEDFADTDQLWLKALLSGLQKDKFIVFRNGIVMIASKE